MEVPDLLGTAMTEEAFKQEGMFWAAGATITWQQRGTDWVLRQPCGARIVSDDVTRDCGVPDSPGAVGALFSSLAKAHAIKPVGYTNSRRTGRHNSMVRVWERL